MKGTRGFSLVELMISAALGLTVVAGIGKVFLFTSNGHRHAQGISQVADALRFAMAQVSHDVAMAGFFAQVHDPEHQLRIASGARSAYTGSCPADWLFDDRTAIDALDNPVDDSVEKRFPCVTGAREGSDVLVVKRVAAGCEPLPRSNRFYLHLGPSGAAIDIGAPPLGASCPETPTGATLQAHQYQPAIWHVAEDAGVYALCREGLSGRGMARRCVMRGIEDLQLEFGLDRPAVGRPGDGIADTFVSFDGRPDITQRRSIVAVRIHLLARSLEAAPCRQDATIRLGNVVHQPRNDGHCRRVLSKTVALRNATLRPQPPP